MARYAASTRDSPALRAGRFGRVRVHGPGDGIAPDVLPRVFGPLFSI